MDLVRKEKDKLLFLYSKIINRYPISVAELNEYKRLIKKYPSFLNGGSNG
jgi:hypothetical protein